MLEDKVHPVVPPCWEAVLDRHVLVAGGPLDGHVVKWHAGLDRLVMADMSGYYELTDGGNFAVWKGGGQDGQR